VPEADLDVDTTWMLDAVCRDLPPEIFFPDAPSRQMERAIDRAKRICDTCPVRPQCLEYALETNQPSRDYGIWGGTDEGERRRIRRRWARAS
jgi:WhiB family redox-sensing transcriptional regulator